MLVWISLAELTSGEEHEHIPPRALARLPASLGSPPVQGPPWRGIPLPNSQSKAAVITGG